MENQLLKLMERYPIDFEEILFSESKEEAFEIASRLIPGYTEKEFRGEIRELRKNVEDELALDLEQLDSVVGGVHINWSPMGDLVQEDPFYRKKVR